MVVNRMIVHSIRKDPHQKTASVLLRADVLPINGNAIAFTQEIESVYLKKNGKSYGIFQEYDTAYPFQNLLRSYTENQTDGTFVRFTKEASELFRKQLDNAQASSGGYLLFIHYENDAGTGYFALIVLQDKNFYAIDPVSLELSSNINLDIQHLNIGLRIHLAGWLEHESLHTSYLSFIKGKKDVSNYFVEFIGCKNFQQAAESTSKLLNAVNGYLSVREIDDAARRTTESNLHRYLKTSASVSLDACANVINPDDPESFLEYMQKNNIEINDNFDADGRVIRSLVRVNYKSRELNFDFSKNLLDTNKVEYDAPNSRLIIKDDDRAIWEKIFGEDDSQ